MVKSGNLRDKSLSIKISKILQGAIFAVSLFLISPAAKSDEKTRQANEYVSVFDAYENWEWEETSDWLKANQKVDEIGGWQYYSREVSEEAN